MSYFRQLIQDAKKGENIELIVTVILAVSLALLQLFDLGLEKYIPALTLAILAVLANAMIVNRYQLNKIAKQNQDRSMGVLNTYPEFPNERANELYRSAKNEICILWTWTARVDPLQSGVFDAIKTGTKIRILVIDPKSVIAAKRLVDMGFKPDSARPAVGMESLHKVITNNHLENKIQIRVYDAMPPFTLYKADDNMLLGFFWHGQGSSKGPHIEMSYVSSVFGSCVMDTFEKLWSTATPVSFDKIE